MAKRVQTGSARDALAGAIRADVERAAGNNDLVSKTEAKTLDPFVRRAEAEVRAEKGSGARVHANEVVDRAMHNAMAVWEQFNPRDRGQNSRYLSQAEIDRITAADPELGKLTKAAYLSASGPIAPAGSVEAIKAQVERTHHIGDILHRNDPTGRVFDARPGSPDREGVPAGVLESHDVFYRAELADWAAASMKSMRLGGQDVYTIYLSTDGDPGYLEIFSAAGEPLASARMTAGVLDRWDPVFGMGRFSGGLGMFDRRVTEGMSEDPDRAAQGQILSTWPPDVVIGTGTVEHDHTSVHDLHTDVQLTPDQKELALAALELMWERGFDSRLAGSLEPLELGRLREGDLRLGKFTNPIDGKNYLVADWRDIDDASFTFYFERTPSGRLDLAIEQFNN